MKILALDIATKTGWAFMDPSGVESGTVNFSPTKGNPGSRYYKARQFFRWVIQPTGEADEPEIIYHEKVFVRGKGTAVLFGLMGQLVEVAGDYNIPLVAVPATKIKKFATGYGKANKKMMIQAAKKFGYYPSDDNEADALCLLEYAISKEKG